MSKHFSRPLKGRGSLSNPDNRFSEQRCEFVDDGWGSLDSLPAKVQTTLTVDSARTIISYNESPDVPFDRSINPYRGCEHGCSYCFARPSHAWLGLSPGIDFETRLFYKPNAAELLRKALSKRRYRCQPIALGINTDAYQPVERKLKITRQILEVLQAFQHPVSIVTKSALIERDVDILGEMAQKHLASVAISIPTLDNRLANKLEPRATAPQRRLETVRCLSEAGIPTSVFVAPLIPVLTDHELESIMAQGREAGAVFAMYILLRLPHEVKDLFLEWLNEHAPLKAEHVMSRLCDAHGGKVYESEFGQRMTGGGTYANLLRQRYHAAMKRLNFPGDPGLACHHFALPPEDLDQLTLF